MTKTPRAAKALGRVELWTRFLKTVAPKPISEKTRM